MGTMDDSKAWKTRINDLGQLIQELRVTTDSVKGTFTPSGLTKGMRTTTMNVGDVAIKLPISALSERNAISIQNKGNSTIYLGNIDVTADTVIGTTSGWEVLAGSYMNFDVTDAIEIYGRCTTGNSVVIKILELA